LCSRCLGRCYTTEFFQKQVGDASGKNIFEHSSELELNIKERSLGMH